MTGLFIGLMLLAGAAIAFQSPVNAALSQRTGPLEAALVSFTVGAAILFVAVRLVGTGSIQAAHRAPPWMLLGGLLGALYITAIVLSVPRLGVTPTLVAALAGQLASSLLIDRMGWFGVPARPLDASRVAALVLFLVALWLLTPKR